MATTAVVPAHAGVFPLVIVADSAVRGRPRARGGLPSAESYSPAMPMSSPRTRGSSAHAEGGHQGQRVVPAHAGVFRMMRAPPMSSVSRPRARGGLPVRIAGGLRFERSSPRTRGSSLLLPR